MFYWRNKIARAIKLGLIHAEGEGGGQGNGGGEGGEGNYYDAFPAEVQTWDEVKNSDSPEKFWQQITSHRQHLGSSIRIPGADAGADDIAAFNTKLQEKVPTLMQTPDLENEESRNAFYGKMGRPETPEDYKIPEFKDGEGKVIEDLDHTLTNHFRKIAHANGLSQAQFAEVVSGVTNINLANDQLAAENLKTEQTAITTAWGAAEDKNYIILKNFAKKTDAPEVVTKALEDKTLDSSTAIWMLKAANASFGDNNRAAGDEGGGDNGVMTPAEAKERHGEIMNNKEHPYWKKMAPGHKEAVARVRELIILQNPETALKPAPGSTFNIGGGQKQ